MLIRSIAFSSQTRKERPITPAKLYGPQGRTPNAAAGKIATARPSSLDLEFGIHGPTCRVSWELRLTFGSILGLYDYTAFSVLKQPHGGIIAPLERRIKLESAAPATRNKLGVVKVDAMFFFFSLQLGSA